MCKTVASRLLCPQMDKAEDFREDPNTPRERRRE